MGKEPDESVGAQQRFQPLPGYASRDVVEGQGVHHVMRYAS